MTDGCPTASGACVHGLAGQGNLEFEFKYKFPEQARLLERADEHRLRSKSGNPEYVMIYTDRPGG